MKSARSVGRIAIVFTCAVLASGRSATLADHPLSTWEGHRNRLLAEPLPTTKQKFGYDAARREIGGFVQRSVAPAWYAKPVPKVTFADKLTASGTFAVTKADNGSNALFGWFNQTTRGWRAPNSLALRVDGNGGKFWVFFEYGTQTLKTGGMGCFEGEQYQTTKTKPFPADGTPHTWELTYDPDAGGGGGAVLFTLDGTKYTLPLAPGHKADGAVFDRFGLWNQQISGKGMEVFFGGLTVNGEKLDLAADPRWEGNGNDGTFPNRFVRPRHDFGFSNTKFCGQAEPGEVGGIVWRDPEPVFYATPVGPLTLDHPLEASGRVVLKAAASDSGMTLGWFDSKAIRLEGKAGQGNRLAIMIEGPSRIGHYFRPVYGTADGTRVVKPSGPVIRPDGTPHTWAMKYDRKAGDAGRITFRLDAAEETFDLKPDHRKAGATFDRFGLFVREPADGHFVEVYAAELKFTTVPPK